MEIDDPTDDPSFDERSEDLRVRFVTLLPSDLVRDEYDSNYKILRPLFQRLAARYVEETWSGKKWDRLRAIDFGVSDKDETPVPGFTWMYCYYDIYWTPE